MQDALESGGAARRGAFPAVVLCALAGMNAAAAAGLPPADGDLGWQRWLGAQVLHGTLPRALGAESFAAPGAPWVAHEWIFAALLAASSAHGLEHLFALAVAACATVALVCVAVRCARAGASPAATAFALVFTEIAMVQSFGVRAQVIGWAMLAALLLALELPGRARWIAVLVAAAWANVHASAVMAPLLCCAAAAGSFAARDTRAARRDLAIAAASAVAVCATPFGVGLPVYAYELAQSPIRHWIREWHAVTLHDGSMTLGLLPLLVFAAFSIRRTPRRALALALPFVYLLFVAVRNVPLAAIAFAPLAALGFDAALPSFAALRPLRARAAGAAMCIAAFVLTAAARTVTAHAVIDDRPVAAIAAAQRTPAHRLFCEDFAWCGDATGTIGVFLDGRADPFPPRVWEDYDTIMHARPDWRRTVRGYRIDAMLVNRRGALDLAAERAGWRVARDGPVRLLLPARGAREAS